MNLLYTNCVPILAYGAEVVEFSLSDMRSFNTTINDAIRRIFSYNAGKARGFYDRAQVFQASMKFTVDALIHSSPATSLVKMRQLIMQLYFICTT